MTRISGASASALQFEGTRAMHRPLHSFAAALLGTALALSATDAPAQTKTLRFVAHADVKILDPTFTTAYISRNFGYMVYDTLFALDAKGVPRPQMVERQHGIVVNIASVAAHIGVSGGGIYATLKAAVTHYTRCLADEVREHGVRVNVVSPGPAKTARFQATRTVDPDKMNSNKISMDRYAEPEEIADAVVFLCSPEAKFIHGQLLRVDGGLQLYAG